MNITHENSLRVLSPAIRVFPAPSQTSEEYSGSTAFFLTASRRADNHYCASPEMSLLYPAARLYIKEKQLIKKAVLFPALINNVQSCRPVTLLATHCGMQPLFNKTAGTDRIFAQNVNLPEIDNKKVLDNEEIYPPAFPAPAGVVEPDGGRR